MMLWGGRFKKHINDLVKSFNSSITVDCKMYKEDIEGSIAHAKMLGNQEIISKQESSLIVKGLKTLESQIEEGKIEISDSCEDIHTFVEASLIDLIGDTGKKLHTARSRNDQVALDLKLYLKKRIKEIIIEILSFEDSLLKKAEENKDTIVSGYTHMQRAQPITYSHYILAYAEMFKRDIGRLEDAFERMDEMPLGSGALATSTYPIDREFVAKELDFKKVTINSLDSVSDRDFVIEIVSALSIVMMHLSRFSEEIVIWCTKEFDFIELDDGFSTGSSIMPQKKNPDVAELVRGKTGRVYGDLITLLTMMKGLPLAYNKDMQEDKEAIFDSIDTVLISLKVFKGMIDTLKIKKSNMREAAATGFTNATDAADYLVKKGIAFRDAHCIIGEMVLYCIDNNKVIEALTMEEFKKFNRLIEDDIYKSISLKTCVEERKVEGGPSITSVNKQIQKLKYFIEEKRK